MIIINFTQVFQQVISFVSLIFHIILINNKYHIITLLLKTKYNDQNG